MFLVQLSGGTEQNGTGSLCQIQGRDREPLQRHDYSAGEIERDEKQGTEAERKKK